MDPNIILKYISFNQSGEMFKIIVNVKDIAVQRQVVVDSKAEGGAELTIL